jgi:glycerol dehydrogenase-like iron-containing ADH family enzyme
MVAEDGRYSQDAGDRHPPGSSSKRPRSTDALCSAVAVRYTEDGVYQARIRSVATMVIVDSAVIVNACRCLSRIGEFLSTRWFEARSTRFQPKQPGQAEHAAVAVSPLRGAATMC